MSPSATAFLLSSRPRLTKHFGAGLLIFLLSLFMISMSATKSAYIVRLLQPRTVKTLSPISTATAATDVFPTGSFSRHGSARAGNADPSIGQPHGVIDDTASSSHGIWPDAPAGGNTSGGGKTFCKHPLSMVWGASHIKGVEVSSYAWPRVAQSAIRCHDDSTLVLCCKPVRRVLILIWTERLFGVPFMPPSRAKVLPFICCHGVQFSYTVDKSLLSSADIVEFHLREFNSVKKPRRTDAQQLWMMFTLEAQYQIADGIGSQMNLWRSFTHSSDIFHPYSDIGECQCSRSRSALTVQFEERSTAPLLVIVSNCNSHTRREGLLRILMNHVDSHSYGSCFHNHVNPPSVPNRDLVATLLPTYKFVFAVENSLCTDYISEKFHRSFPYGTVPVVVSARGKPGYQRYAPTNTSFLDVSLFKDAAEAAHEIKISAANRVKYSKYHTHRLPNALINVSTFYNSETCQVADDGRDRSWCKLAEQFATSEGRANLANRRRHDLSRQTDCLPRGYLGHIFK